ncbi:MAG TPA: pyridoxamine kinase [Clostridiales bacterium]|nr:pyridoxamine kinase [Clostridiales bacterium]
MVKRIAAINDISCFGRCSMQVIWPVLSHFGHQVCPLPTALLSAHTGGFDGYSFFDLSEEMEKIATHWRELDLSFDAIYSGFLGSGRQIEIVKSFINDFERESTLVLVDPVMGDNGMIYRTYTKEMCDGIKVLCKSADVITPNLTEAYLLLGIPYGGQPDSGKQKEMLDALLKIGNKKRHAVIITGIHNAAQGTIGAVFAIKDHDEVIYGSSYATYCDVFFPGCGDLFSSILLGELLNGRGIYGAIKAAVQFISKVSSYAKRTGSPPIYGVEFEQMIRDL